MASASSALEERFLVEVMFNDGQVYTALRDELLQVAPRPFPLIRIHLDGSEYVTAT